MFLKTKSLSGSTIIHDRSYALDAQLRTLISCGIRSASLSKGLVLIYVRGGVERVGGTLWALLCHAGSTHTV